MEATLDASARLKRAPAIVRALVAAGAKVDACGVTRTTALHMAARRGFTGIVAALLDSALTARDTKGVTPLQRARNCRQLMPF